MSVPAGDSPGWYRRNLEAAGLSVVPMKRRPVVEPEPHDQTPLLGVCSVMMVMIPALVLMAHVVEYTAIEVIAPRIGGQERSNVISCGRPLDLRVAIAGDGFYTRIGGGAWQRAGAPIDGYDHEALGDRIDAIARDYPHETVVRVTASEDVPFAMLVATLDTLRGRECELAGALAGEAIPPQCRFWQPIVEGTPDLDALPPWRRLDAWPTPAHRGEEPMR